MDNQNPASRDTAPPAAPDQAAAKRAVFDQDTRDRAARDHAATPAAAIRDAETTAPWDRFGWIMAVIWLFFLTFPVLDVLERSGWERAVGLVVIATFATVYTVGFVRFPLVNPSQRVQNLTLTALIGVAALAAVIIGPVALTFVPFIAAFGVYFQPVRRSIALSGMWVVLTAVALTVTSTWSTLGIMVVIVTVVSIVTFVPRWLDEQQQAHVSLRAEYTRIAEQERVARDVHDVLGHSLTVIAVKAELAGRLVERAEVAGEDSAILDGVAQEIAAIESLSREALSEIRATVAGLRIARLDTEMENAAEALHSAGVQLEVAGEPDGLDPRYRLIAGWVLREAVTNVVRHAGAKTCRIVIGPDSLVVSDDGTGFSPDVAGSGILGLRERVRMSGGKLTIQHQADGGTRLAAQW